MNATAPIILFAHGAGAPSSHPWMQAWARRLGTLGMVVTFDYPYMAQRRKTPDRMPVLLAAHRQALDDARARHGRDRRFVLAGKSMGSRVGCHLAAALAADTDPSLQPAAVVCFGYPLRGQNGALRDQALLDLTTPTLLLTGTRDPLCPRADLASVLPRLRAPHQVFWVEGGNHSLDIPKRQAKTTGKDQDAWNQDGLTAIARFLSQYGIA